MKSAAKKAGVKVVTGDTKVVEKGKKLPMDCGLFGKTCIPESPHGPCMVSSEGTCSAYYKYGGRDWL